MGLGVPILKHFRVRFDLLNDVTDSIDLCFLEKLFS